LGIARSIITIIRRAELTGNFPTSSDKMILPNPNTASTASRPRNLSVDESRSDTELIAEKSGYSLSREHGVGHRCLQLHRRHFLGEVQAGRGEK